MRWSCSTPVWSFVACALLALLVAPAVGVSLRRQCRLACKDAINLCVAAGGKRGRCRRQTLRRCRREGLTACGGAATTTTLPSGVTVNGCEPTSATDLRGRPQVTVHFGGALGLRYQPACFQVSPGTQVTFSGEFDQHPLVGGAISGGGKMPDPSSPFDGPTSTGTSKTFTLPVAATLPFYCDVHALVGMKGAAFVAP